nr:reverse transcriptase domain-containing protein [Tanacetum cinerariifolium]
MIPTTSSSLPPVVERETEATKDTVHPTNNGSTIDVQPPVVQTESPILNFEPVVTPIIEPVVTLISASKPNQRLLIPYPSRLHDQKLRDKANDQRGKFFQIFKDLNFNISFADALILMPKFGLTIKTLLTNNDKLSELTRTPLNEHCSTVLLKKFPEKLEDPGKFLIPLWNKLSLPDLSPTCMTLELADHSISCLVGVAEDVLVKVGKFHFPADFVVVDFDADPRVPLILKRSFLKTERALIDVRSHVDPTLLNDFEMAAKGNSDLPVPDLQTMEELCQPSLNGRGGPIAPIAIQATNFGLKNDMIQQSIKVNGVPDDALRLYLFPHSLTHRATAWFDRLPRNSINTFEQMAKMFLGKYFSPSMVTKLRNEITNFCQRPDESLFEVWEHYKLSIDRCPNHNMLPVTQIDTFYNGLTLRHRDIINAAAATPNCKTSGGPHSYTDCPATVGETQNVYAVGAYQ